jgi:uncharacterized protein (DUF1778 family)
MPITEKVRDTLPKTERLEARVTSQVKELIQQAADLQGRSLTDFILNNLQDAARKVIHEHKVMELSVADSKMFVKSLLNPPEPNARLKKAARRHKMLSDNK